jgi:hypothetical protein
VDYINDNASAEFVSTHCVVTRKNYEGTSEHTYKDIKNSDGNGEYLLRVTCHYPCLSLFYSIVEPVSKHD